MLHLLLDIQSAARQTQNACVSPVSGATLYPEIYGAAQRLLDACKPLVKEELDRKAQYGPKDENPSGFGYYGDELPTDFVTEYHGSETCICQRAYNAQRVGIAHIDNWLEITRGEWPHDWYRQVYHNGDPAWRSDEFDVATARKIKSRIEANCKATSHYALEMSDLFQGGRAVYTSLDVEKQAELQEAATEEAWNNANLWAVRAKTEYRGDDADLVDGETGSDALARQRRPEEKEENVEQTLLTLEVDVEGAERKAESKARREERKAKGEAPRDTFEALYAQNLGRIAAKNAAARRSLWFLIRSLDEDERALYTEYVKEQKRNRMSFVEILRDVRKSIKAKEAVCA